MKTAILLLVLLFASAVRADEITVSETTFYEPNLLWTPLAPGQSIAEFIITGNYDPAAGYDGLNPFYSELPLIYQILGINLQPNQFYINTNHAYGRFVGEELYDITNLPPGISVNSTLDVPRPTVAPEPGTLLLLGSGLGIGALGALRRRIV